VCKSYSVNHRIALVAAFLLRDFDTILGDHLRHRLEKLLLFKKTPDRCQTPQDWAYFLIHSQLDNTLDRKQAFSKWDKEAACFQGTQRQYHYEPEVTLLDLIMGEWTGNYSPRSLKDHPCHLEAALIDPLKVELPLAQKNWAQRVWLYQGVTHSTFLQALCETEVLNDEITFLLSESCIEDQVEISYYVNKAADTQLWIENAKATSFELGQKLTLLTGGQRFEMTFSLEEGAGHFWGHIYYGNRPHQTGNKGIFKFDVFDLKIALRTVQRKQKCMIKLKFKCLGENRTMLESKLNNEIAQI
jgi:hypothetical protein